MKKIIFSQNNINYQTLTESKFLETVGLIAKIFTYQEYAIKGAGLKYEDLYLFANLYCKASLKSELSIIATCAITGEVLGFCINEDPYSKNSVDTKSFMNSNKEAYNIFLSLLNELNEYNDSTHIEDENLHL